MEQPKIWDYVLGETAEVNNIANNVVDESSGSPSFRSLYPEITGVPIADGGIPVKRKDINALFKLIGEQIFFIQRGGTYKWDYNATYPIGAIVLHNGAYYRAIAENTSRDPSVDTDSWKPLVEVKPEDLENIQVEDGSLTTKGVVQLTNEISDDETLAVTPKAVKELLDQLNELINEVNDTNTTISALQETTTTNATEIASLKSKDIQFDNKLTELESLIGDGSEIDLSGIQSQLDELKAKDTQIEETINNLNLDTIPQDVEDLKTSDSTQNANILELQTTTNNLNNTISQLSATVDGYQGSIDQATSNADLALETAQGLDATVGENTSDISNLKTNLQNLIDDYGELTDNLVGVYKYSSDYEYEVKDIVYDNNVFYECVQTSKGNPLTNTDYFKKIEDQSLIDRLVTLETDSTTYGSDISSLTTRVQALEDGSSGSQDLTEIETRLDTAETNISSLQSADVTLSDRITALENGSGGDTSALETRVETVEGKVTTLENGLNDKADSSTVTALDTRVTALENGSGGSSTDLTELTQRVTDTESDIETINSTLNGKADKSQLTSINNDISSLTSQVSALDTEVDSKANTSDLQTTNANISALDTRVGTVETSLASKAENSAVTANASSISALDTRVTALENSSSGGSGGTAYSIYSLDTAGVTGDGVAMNDETYVTYEADGANAITGVSVSGRTITININHAGSLRRFRVYGSFTDLGAITAPVTDPIKVRLMYDDADPNSNSYDEFNVGWILPQVQTFLSGDGEAGSVQGHASYMSVSKAIWNFDFGYPELRISLTGTLANPLIVIVNF